MRIAAAAAEVADARTGAAAGARTAVEEVVPGVEAAAGPRRCMWRVEACPGCTEAVKGCRPWVVLPEPAAVGTTAGAGAVDSYAEAAGRIAAAGEASAEAACSSRQRSPPPLQRLRRPSCGCRPESGR